MKLFGGIIVLLFLFVSCSDSEVDPVVLNTPTEDTLEKELAVVMMPAFVLDSFSNIGLGSVADYDSRILIDLRYTTSNNFMGKVLYDTLNKAFLQTEVIERLVKCQDFLDSIKPGYRLKVYDAVRPLGVQRDMWHSLDTVPMWKRGKFVSNPVFGSVHNYGCAVDITICDADSNELDMGAGYDDFRDIAFPSKESQFLKTGELTNEQYQNRLLLRKVMRSQKFSNIPSEWWHFNAFSRPTSERMFEILLDESGHHQHWVSPRKDTSLIDSLIPRSQIEISDSIFRES